MRGKMMIVLLCYCLLSINTLGQVPKIVKDDTMLVPSSYIYIEDGVTLVPLRIIAEALGAKVTWHSEEHYITVEKDSIILLVSIDDYKIGKRLIGEVTTTKYYTSHKAPRLENGVTLIPLRTLVELLEGQIEYTPWQINISFNASINQALQERDSLNSVGDYLQSKKWEVGSTKLSFRVYANKSENYPMDYEIAITIIEPNLEKLTSEDKAMLKNYMKELAQDLIVRFPKVKFIGEFDQSDDTHLNDIKLKTYCSWKNYEGDFGTPYQKTKASEFRWFEKYDEEIW